MPTFAQVYNALLNFGIGRAISSRGTRYRIEAINGNIVAFPKAGRVTVHKDCWMSNTTCQGTRAGGIYNGQYTIIDWYHENNA
mgnify:CR=1